MLRRLEEGGGQRTSVVVPPPLRSILGHVAQRMDEWVVEASAGIGYRADPLTADADPPGLHLADLADIDVENPGQLRAAE
ncbi:hypothetical protein GCM10009639_13270 [Kitasatospora putterlickiae]|uniref:Uncharacterized protein n=1 Tax=Kitasatospora putterlickiae TaxID=221725 RepID=A0ABN1XQR5_9ACTN